MIVQVVHCTVRATVMLFFSFGKYVRFLVRISEFFLTENDDDASKLRWKRNSKVSESKICKEKTLKDPNYVRFYNPRYNSI